MKTFLICDKYHVTILIFASREAAQWWMDHEAIGEFYIQEMTLYSLEEAKELWS